MRTFLLALGLVLFACGPGGGPDGGSGGGSGGGGSGGSGGSGGGAGGSGGSGGAGGGAGGAGGGAGGAGGGGGVAAGTPGWVAVQPTTFTMGAPASDVCRGTDETQHAVTLTRPYELPPKETTQAEYAARLGFNPSYRPQCGADCPVENVNWHLAAAYCNALSRQAGRAECYGCDGGAALADGGFSAAFCEVAPAYATSGATLYHCPGYRLPYEAEWENAYRAGTQTPLYNGTYAPGADGGCPTVGVEPTADAIAWYTRNSSSQTHAVALKQPNGWGLFDLGGNVAELTNDLYVADLTNASVIDPTGGTSGTQVVLRGGHFASSLDEVRAPQRKPQTKDGRGTGVGFRCARSL